MYVQVHFLSVNKCFNDVIILVLCHTKNSELGPTFNVVLLKTFLYSNILVDEYLL